MSGQPGMSLFIRFDLRFILISCMERVPEGMSHAKAKTTTCTHHVADFPHSLIAILLGRLRMTVDGALIEYRNLGDKIFHPSRKQSRFNPISRLTKWDARGLESAVEDLVRRLYPQPPGFNQDIPTGRNIFSQLPSPNDLCKVLVSLLPPVWAPALY